MTTVSISIYQNLHARLIDLYLRGSSMTPRDLHLFLDQTNEVSRRMVSSIIQERRPQEPVPVPVPVQEKTKERQKCLSKKSFEALCFEECSICLEVHKRCESITTSCFHVFGKDCFQSYEANLSGNKRCPLCRQTYTQITSYKLSKRKTTREMHQMTNGCRIILELGSDDIAIE
jgi:hypothetical protein